MSVCIDRVRVMIIKRFIVHVIAIGVAVTGSRRGIIRKFRINMTLIRPVAEGSLAVRPVRIGMAGVGVAVLISVRITVPAVLVGTVIIWIIVGLGWSVVVLGTFWSFLQDGPDRLILC